MTRRVFRSTDNSVLLGSWVNRQLWLEMLFAAAGASALMALVAGLLVLSRTARDLRAHAAHLQNHLSVGLTSYQPLYNLQRQLQQAASSQEVTMALVVDQRGLVLAATNNALVGRTLPQVLQQPNQRPLRELFDECPSTSSLLSCLTRDEVLFHGPVPWIGGDVLISMRPYPLALEGGQPFTARATLITVTDVRGERLEVLLFVLQVFVAGLLPLLAGCLGMLALLRRELIPELLRLAQIDALSGIYNRRAFLEAAEELLGRARAAGVPVTLALIDVDHFKRINDSHGHDAGDAVVREVSELLRQAVRSGDLVGRLGGDEFAILVQLPAPAAGAMLERTRSLIQHAAITTAAGEPVQVDLSIGLASSDGPSGHGLAELTTAADAALYVAKDRGRAQVVNLEEESRASPSSRPGGQCSASGRSAESEPWMALNRARLPRSPS
jgi:diguanylate cyclase (GGDEF)-like protein